MGPSSSKGEPRAPSSAFRVMPVRAYVTTPLYPCSRSHLRCDLCESDEIDVARERFEGCSEKHIRVPF
jgi:hypothetical protein